MNEDPLALLPEALLLVGAVLALLTGSFSPRDRQGRAGVVAALAATGSLIAAVAAAGSSRLVYEHSFAIDAATTTGRLVITAATLLVLALARDTVRGTARESEFYVLVLLASCGASLLSGASDLLLLLVGYLLASIPLYALAGWARNPGAAEAALKTYLLGALFGIVMMLGVAVLTAVGGGQTTYRALAAGLPGAAQAAVAFGVVAVLAGLLFKIGAVPAHFWVPDAVSGATVPAAAFLTTVPKIGGLLATYRFVTVLPDTLVDWRLLVAVLAAASMTLGNLAAFGQDDPKRLLAYSTVSQVGYLLMAVAVAGRTADALPALAVYLAGYSVTNLGAFAVVAALPGRTTIQAFRGAARPHPWLMAALLACLLGLVGTPPTAVFVGKLNIFTATWDGGMQWLVVLAAVNTVASLYYYLRWLGPAMLPTPRDSTDLVARSAAPVALLCGVGALVVGLSAAVVSSAGFALMR